MFIHSLHESRVAVSWLSSSQFVFECGDYRVIVMAGQVNVSLNISEDDVNWSLINRRCDLYSLIINGYILAVVIIVGIIGNSLTFVVFWKGNFKSSTSFLFLSLSLADSALLLTSIPLDVVWVFAKYTGWLPGFLKVRPYLNAYIYPLFLVARMATIWVRVIIASNRYIVVCVPLRACKWCTLSKVKIQLAVVLVVTFMCNIPQFLKCRVISYTLNNGTSYATRIDCSTEREWIAFYKPYVVVMHLMLMSSVPLFILTLLTVRLVKAMKAHRQMLLEMNRVSNNQDSSVTSAFVIVVVVFIICHTPLFVAGLLVRLLMGNYESLLMLEVFFFVWKIGSMLVILNSAVNFAIYILACKSFRDVLIETVCRRRTDMQVVIAHHEEGVNDEPGDDHDTPL